MADDTQGGSASIMTVGHVTGARCVRKEHGEKRLMLCIGRLNMWFASFSGSRSHFRKPTNESSLQADPSKEEPPGPIAEPAGLAVHEQECRYNVLVRQAPAESDRPSVGLGPA